MGIVTVGKNYENRIANRKENYQGLAQLAEQWQIKPSRIDSTDFVLHTSWNAKLLYLPTHGHCSYTYVSCIHRAFTELKIADYIFHISILNHVINIVCMHDTSPRIRIIIIANKITEQCNYY